MWEKVLGETDDNIYLWTVLYYDIHGRVVQESHSSHRGGWQRTNTGYDFTDHPLKSQTVSNDTSAGSLTELYTYSYDAWGRPSTVTHKLDALSAVVLHNYEYDEAGRVISDARNGDADLKERYSYNVRSWKTDIKVGGNSQQGTLGETFMEKLYYNTQRPSSPQTTVQWGGNVSATDWMAGSDGVTRRYDFGYDGMSRLTGAAYADDNGGAGLYNRSYSYDRNSNITAVTTPSGTVQMSYVGNHLNGNNYDYDANGNLTKDLGRSIASIDYNQLNLPSCVSLSGSIVDGELLLYSASGAKLEAKDLFPVILPGNTDNRPRTDYVGNLIYDKTSLKKVLVPGGYIEVSGTSRLYRFFVSDHLGGNRLVTDASGSILQTNHYDPYGQSLPAGAAVDSGNPYKFSGKEYDTQASSYDFGARFYTFSNPRWTTMDPLCEKYYSISPYAYCAGNPVNLVDPEGLSTWVRKRQDGIYEVIGGDYEDNDLNIYEYHPDENGNYTKRGAAIGKTTSITSFYNGNTKGDTGNWALGSIIDLNDRSGKEFLDFVVDADLPVFAYALYALPYMPLDFKRTNGVLAKHSVNADPYRGMVLGYSNNALPIISSARDVGNMAAGYEAGINGLEWSTTRLFFDTLESFQQRDFTKEIESSQNAQRYGWENGRKKYVKKDKKNNFGLMMIL